MASQTPRNIIVRDASGHQRTMKIVQAPVAISGFNSANGATNIVGNFQVGQKLVLSPHSAQKREQIIVKPDSIIKPEPMKPESATYTFSSTPGASAAAMQQSLSQNSNSSPSQPTAIKREASWPAAAPPPVTHRRRKNDKAGKGLRHFSMRVCEKVEEKGTTTYNEVADELVAEETAGSTNENAVYDQKNIRRRVYDALNVLMAMNIISKEKKEIRWIGLPTNSAQECQELEKENRERRKRIEAKQQQLKQLILQQVAFTSLVNRNREVENRGQQPSSNSSIQLPFILVNTNKKTHIDCSISNDKTEYSFKFDDKFEINDDLDVLKKMGLLQGLDNGKCSEEDIERFKKLVPKSLQKYIEIYGRGEEESLGLGEGDEDDDDECSNYSFNSTQQPRYDSDNDYSNS